MNNHFELKPVGIEFHDGANGHDLILVTTGQWKNWFLFHHPDGNYVAIRESKPDERTKIMQMDLERNAATIDAFVTGVREKFPRPSRGLIRKGTGPCPKCGMNLVWVMYSNGHVGGRCETPKCLDWRE